jgi:hypothetical protein
LLFDSQNLVETAEDNEGRKVNFGFEVGKLFFFKKKNWSLTLAGNLTMLQKRKLRPTYPFIAPYVLFIPLPSVLQSREDKQKNKIWINPVRIMTVEDNNTKHPEEWIHRTVGLSRSKVKPAHPKPQICSCSIIPQRYSKERRHQL